MLDLAVTFLKDADPISAPLVDFKKFLLRIETP